MLEPKIIEALKKACEMHGGQVNLAKASTVSQGQISDYLCGRRKIQNMTIGTLEKLFPEIELIFFKKQIREADFVETEIIDIIHNLDPQEKAQCLKILAASFPNKILEESKR